MYQGSIDLLNHLPVTISLIKASPESSNYNDIKLGVVMNQLA